YPERRSQAVRPRLSDCLFLRHLFFEVSMERILVVEDDLALSAGLLFELDSAGYVSVPAYNCAKARALLADGAFSLILLDVNLPDGNGFDLCREIKAQNAMQPVIFLTANDLEEDVLNGFDLG